jgi:hypothetical protein
MSASDYLESKILDHIFSEATFTAPTWYIGLSTADPGEDGSGVAEPADANYARQALGGTTRTSSTVVNDSDITFPTAGAGWGTITHFALFDSASGGNMLASAALTESKTINAGDSAKFSASALQVTLT